jgi:hypothetical protein
VFREDVNITQIVREIQLEDQNASSDQAVKQHEQKASSKAAKHQQIQPKEESKRRGVRATVSDFMKGKKLERKSSTKTLRRQPSAPSQLRKYWRD